MAEEKKTGEKKHITGARIAKEIRQYKKDALLSPMYTTLCVVLEILIPYLTASIIDKGIAVGDMEHVAKIGSLMAVMAILAMVFGIRAGIHSARASTGLAANLRESMFGRIQDYSFSNIDRFSTAGLVTRLTTDVTNIQNAFQMILQICTRAPVTLIVALFMAFSISAKLSTVFLVAIAFLGVMIVILIPKAMRYFRQMFRKYDAVNGVVKENVGAIRVVKAFVREEYEDEKFSGAADDLFKNSISAERIISFSMPIMQLTVYACILVISWFGAKMIVSQTGLTTGELTSLLSYVMNILMSLMMLSMVFVMVTQSAAAAQRIEEVLEEQPDITSPENAVKTVKDGSIDFDHVTFAYQQRSGKPVLSDIDLHIQSGETIGIMGGTGSSKSSLVNLISRLYDVTAGEVRVGGVDVRRYDVESLRDAGFRRAAKQRAFLRHDLRQPPLGRQKRDRRADAGRPAIWRVRMNLSSVSRKNTTPASSSGGTNVSGGQKQRLCIARALLKKPKVLILDDSTSAVDTATDAKIREAMRTHIPGTTKIIIAQRISSIQDADRVLVLDNGRVNAFDTPENLLKTNAIYQEVYNSQVGNGGGDFDEAAMKGGD